VASAAGRLKGGGLSLRRSHEEASGQKDRRPHGSQASEKLCGRVALRVVTPQTDKVFLLLFVHKKKTLT
jgi:hypothetical protein